MVEPDGHRFDTQALHAGQRPDPTTGSRAVPIHQTTSYVFDSVDHAAGLFNLETSGHIYSRISNPTVAVLEERIAALEGGVGAVATASGQAALHLAVATLLDAGDHIVSSRNLYGGSHNLMNLTMPRFGITTTFVDPHDPQAFLDAVRPETKLFYGEVLGNPGLEVLDIAAVADAAHSAGVPLAVDSTFATPYLLRPIEHGADIITHSVTKFLGGHGVAIGGVVVDGGRFDWAASGRFPTLSEPYDGYHGITFTQEFGPQALSMRARAEGLRDFGACMSPANAFYLLQGIETLPIRMARHVTNTGRVLDLLDGHASLSERFRCDPQLRGDRWPRSWPQVHRRGAAGFASGQRGRRQDTGHPPGVDHPPADELRRPGGGRRRRESGPGLGGPRRPGRHLR